MMNLSTRSKSDLTGVSLVNLYALRLEVWDEIDVAEKNHYLAKAARLTQYAEKTISSLIRQQEGLHEAD